MTQPVPPATGRKDALLRGFLVSPAASFFLLVIPAAVGTFFTVGLADAGIVIAASPLLLCFLALFLVLLPRTTIHKARDVAFHVAGILAAVAGLAWFVDLSNRDALIPLALVALALSALFSASYLDALARRDAAPPAPAAGPWQARAVEALGAASTLLAGLPFLFLPRGGGIAMLVTGVAAFAVPLASKATRDWREPDRASRPPRGHVTPVVLDLFVATFLLVHVAGSRGAWPVAAAGMVAGFVASVMLQGRSGSMHVVARTLLFVAIITFPTDTGMLRAAWIGIVQGHAIASILARASAMPTGPRRGATGWGAFFLLLAIMLGSALGTYGDDILADPATAALLLLPVTVAGLGVVTVATCIELATWRGLHDAIRRATRAVQVPRRAASRPLKITTVAFTVLAPVLAGAGIAGAGFAVTITLPATMYDVDGNPVTSVTLGPSSARILFHAPGATATGSEAIRPGKSVRLGGYYYGYGESFSRADVIDWVGHHNDVFSFGFMGTGGTAMMPANISTIKAMNPDAKFYYMAFATTLFESAGAPGSGPAWGNSHYPTMQFNATLHDMTLKLVNGSEARGVRRDAEHLDAHLMDLGNMAWADYFAWIYENRSIEFHADGVAIDEVMWRGYWDVEKRNQGVALRDYTSLDQIVDSCNAWLARIREKMSVEIMTQAFWPSAMVHQDGVWGEIAFRAGGPYGGPVSDANQDVWYEPMTWQQIVENARDITGEGKSYIWAAWYEDGDLAGLEYAIATYLMAKPNGCTALAFQPHPGYYPADGLVGYSVQRVAEEVATRGQYFDIELGNATGEMVLRQGAGGRYWQRDFANGIVLVNPFRARLFA